MGFSPSILLWLHQQRVGWKINLFFILRLNVPPQTGSENGFISFYYEVYSFTFRHKVVIVEGNYLLLDDGVWKEISSMFDEKW